MQAQVNATKKSATVTLEDMERIDAEINAFYGMPLQTAVKRQAKAAAQSAEKATTSCWKCSGRGRIECYRHVEGGVCFACNGAGVALAKA